MAHSAVAPSSPVSSAPGERVPLLEELRLDHGPIERLGAFLLRADAALVDRGIRLYRCPISELVRVNALNRESWGAFSPILDVRVAPLGPADSYCLTGTTASGEIVVAQGGRLLDTMLGTLQDLADSQSIYYGHPHQPDIAQPRCTMNVPMARELRGRLVCSGGTWVKPSHRGLGLAAILPRISRTLALGWWNTDYTISFLSDSLAKSPVLKSYGYTNIQPGYSIQQNGQETYRGSLVWMSRAAMLDDLQEFQLRGLAEIDRQIDRGGRQQQSAPAR